MKKILTLTIVFIMLFIMVIPTFAAVDDDLSLPSTVMLKSGYHELTLTTNVAIPFDSTLIDLVVSQLNLLQNTPFRYRFTNDGYTNYLSNFRSVQDTSTEWRILGDSANGTGLTVFRFITSGTRTLIEHDFVQLVCIEDTAFNNAVYYLRAALQPLNYIGLAPSILYYLDLQTDCPTLAGLLSTYEGTFDSIVDMLNPTNSSEYSEEMNAAFNRGLTVGGSKVYGQNIIGDTLSAPFAAMNELTIVTTPLGTITLADVVSTVIVIMLVILFLKLFAGG